MTFDLKTIAQIVGPETLAPTKIRLLYQIRLRYKLSTLEASMMVLALTICMFLLSQLVYYIVRSGFPDQTQSHTCLLTWYSYIDRKQRSFHSHPGHWWWRHSTSYRIVPRPSFSCVWNNITSYRHSKGVWLNVGLNGINMTSLW